MSMFKYELPYTLWIVAYNERFSHTHKRTRRLYTSVINQPLQTPRVLKFTQHIHPLHNPPFLPFPILLSPLFLCERRSCVCYVLVVLIVPRIFILNSMHALWHWLWWWANSFALTVQWRGSSYCNTPQYLNNNGAVDYSHQHRTYPTRTDSPRYV